MSNDPGWTISRLLAEHLPVQNPQLSMFRCQCTPDEDRTAEEWCRHIEKVVCTDFTAYPKPHPLDLPTRVADLVLVISHGEYDHEEMDEEQAQEWRNGFNRGMARAAFLFRDLVAVDTLDEQGNPHRDVLRNHAGRVITEEDVQDHAPDGAAEKEEP